MANTFDLISNQTLASDAQTISISLPSDYTDIQIQVSLRSNRSGYDYEVLHCYINSDTNTANYKRTEIYAEGGSLGGELNVSDLQVGVMPATTALANLFGDATFYLPQYRNSSTKIYNLVAGFQITGGPTRYHWATGVYWNSTAAISTFNIKSPSGQWVTGSKVKVYGIKKYT